jgi:hypothetical protein
MPRKPLSNGRPTKVVDWEQVDKMLEYHMSGAQIASYYTMHPETFYKKVQEKYDIGFTEYQQSRRNSGKKRILEAQFKKATVNMDSALLVHLGKHICDQDEKDYKKEKEEERESVRDIAIMMKGLDPTFKSDTDIPIPPNSDGQDCASSSDDIKKCDH